MNKVILIGNITKDLELKKTTSGLSVISFTLAVAKPYNKDAEQAADFINCVAWRGQADNLYKYQGKGSKIAISGRLQTRTYQTTDGSNRHVVEVVADEVYFLSSKNQNSQQVGSDPSPYDNMPDETPDNNNDDLPF